MKNKVKRAPAPNRKTETWPSPCSYKKKRIRNTEKNRLGGNGSEHSQSNILSKLTFPYPLLALEAILEEIPAVTILPVAALRPAPVAARLFRRRGEVPTVSAIVPIIAPVHSLPLLLNGLCLHAHPRHKPSDP